MHESQVQVIMLTPFVSGELTDFGGSDAVVDRTGFATSFGGLCVESSENVHISEGAAPACDLS